MEIIHILARALRGTTTAAAAAKVGSDSRCEAKHKDEWLVERRTRSSNIVL